MYEVLVREIPKETGSSLTHTDSSLKSGSRLFFILVLYMSK